MEDLDLDIIQKRFDELSAKANEIVDSMATHQETRRNRMYFGEHDKYRQVTVSTMDHEAAKQWRVKAKSLLGKLFGTDDPVYQEFVDQQKIKTSHARFRGFRSVFEAAKDEYEGGYAVEFRNLAKMAIFNDELEQATYLLAENWLLPAAVIAGTVLESTLRQLCDQSSIALSDKSKASFMNNQLKPSGVFGETQRAQNEAWLKIRNDAAHGKPEFESVTKNDINRMIEGIREFIEKHMN